MTTLPNKILDTIHKEHVHPAPRWTFIAKQDALWGAFAVSVIIGSFAVSVILYMLITHEWELADRLDKSFGEYALLSLPYVWIVALGGFAVLAYLNYVHTKHGYRHRGVVILGTSVVASVVLGTVFYTVGFGFHIDRVLSNRVPIYERMLIHKRMIWQNPEQGILAGRILRVTGDDIFIMRDMTGTEWMIEFESAEDESTFSLDPGDMVRMLGTREQTDLFEAEKIQVLDTPPPAFHRPMFHHRPLPR